MRTVLAASLGLCLLAASAGAQDNPARPFGEQYGWTTARFAPTEADFKAAGRSAVLPAPARIVEQVRADFPIIPRFGGTEGQRTVTVDLPEGSTTYGFGSLPEVFTLAGTFEAVPGLKCLLLVVHAGGDGFVLIADTTHPVDVQIGRTIELRSAAPVLPVIVSAAATPMDLATAVADLTGRIEMPTRWGLGLTIECGSAQAARKAAEWAGAGLGAIAVPASTQGAELRALREAGAPAHLAIVLNQEGPAAGEAGPEVLALSPPEAVQRQPSVPDLTDGSGLQWWAEGVGAARDAGATGAILHWLGAHPDLRYRGTDWWGPGDGRTYGPLQPRQAVSATRTGLALDESGERPFVVASDWVMGTQRFAASTTTTSIPQILNLSLSGQHLVGARAHRLEDLATAICALPVAVGVADAEGKLGGERELLRSLLRVRTRLTPYLYTLAFESYYRGQPIVRPVFFADPGDASLRAIDWCYLLGADVLVVPAPTEGPRRESPLKGWRRISLGEQDACVPHFYLRPGAILPTASAEQAIDAPLDPLILLVYPDGAGRAQSMLYEDDGHTFGLYRQQFRYAGHGAEVKEGAAYVRLSLLNGGLGMPDRKLRAVILTEDGEFAAEGTELGTLRIPLAREADQSTTEPR